MPPKKKDNKKKTDEGVKKVDDEERATEREVILEKEYEYFSLKKKYKYRILCIS